MSEATGVSHVTTGLRKILEFSFVYNFWQRITGSESAKRKIIQNHVQPFSKAKWLDIGCGTGALLEHVDAKLKIDFVGYDLNSEYIAFAKNKYATRGRFYCTSINRAKLFEENFDIATAIAIVHHLDDIEAEKLIKEKQMVTWKDVLVFPMNEFLSRFFARQGYKDGLHGFVLSLLMAFYWEIVFTKVWERKENFRDITPDNFLSEVLKEFSKAARDIKYWIYEVLIRENPVKKIYYKIRRELR